MSFRIGLASRLAVFVGVCSHWIEVSDEEFEMEEVRDACSAEVSLLQLHSKPRKVSAEPNALLHEQTLYSKTPKLGETEATTGPGIVLLAAGSSNATNWQDVSRSAAAFPFLPIALAAMLPVAVCVTVKTWFAEAFVAKPCARTWIDMLLNERTRRGTFFVLIYIALLVGNDVLANATANAHEGTYPWNPLVVVFLVEIGKAACSAGLLCVTRESQDTLEPSEHQPQQDPGQTRMLWFRAAVRTFPVASLYAGNNYLVLFVLSKIHLDSFVIWRNSAILFNAFFWMVYFKRSLQKKQLMGVGALLIGCCLSTFQVDGTVTGFSWPVLLVLCSALASSLGAVFNEGLLKTKTLQDGLGLNGLNVLLYVECTAILSVAVIYQQYQWFNDVRAYSVFHGVDRSATLLIIMSVSLGLVISRVLFYTDSITKVMAGGVRELATILIAPFFTVSRCDWISIASALWVFLAVVVYFVPSADSKKPSLKEAPFAQPQPAATDVAISPQGGGTSK